MSWADEVAALNAAVLEEFGEAVSYQRPPAAAFSVTAVVGTPGSIEGLDPAYLPLTVRLSDFGAAAPAAGDACTIAGVTYSVVDVGPDVGGMARLALKRTGTA